MNTVYIKQCVNLRSSDLYFIPQKLSSMLTSIIMDDAKDVESSHLEIMFATKDIVKDNAKITYYFCDARYVHYGFKNKLLRK